MTGKTKELNEAQDRELRRKVAEHLTESTNPYVLVEFTEDGAIVSNSFPGLDDAYETVRLGMQFFANAHRALMIAAQEYLTENPQAAKEVAKDSQQRLESLLGTLLSPRGEQSDARGPCMNPDCPIHGPAVRAMMAKDDGEMTML